MEHQILQLLKVSTRLQELKGAEWILVDLFRLLTLVRMEKRSLLGEILTFGTTKEEMGVE